jgi:hypothetical protein
MAVLAVVAMLSGCRPSGSERSAQAVLPNGASAVDLDALLAKSLEVQRPILVLITESGQGDADNNARARLEDAQVQGNRDRVTSVVIDLSISRNRATAARFHVSDTPLLVCLSPQGVIISRDEQPITKDLVLKRINEAEQRATDLDSQFKSLEKAVATNPNQAGAKLNLADFLLAHQNSREAIPHLASVAHSDAFETSARVRAWVDLARAHLWIAEPEKGRHEAQDLIATLGPTTAEALAGGNLVLGLQDAKGKRFALARAEFAAATSAAPNSVFAKQATEALVQLPKEEK